MEVVGFGFIEKLIIMTVAAIIDNAKTDSTVTITMRPKTLKFAIFTCINGLKIIIEVMLIVRGYCYSKVAAIIKDLHQSCYLVKER